jgi:arylformamidase
MTKPTDAPPRQGWLAQGEAKEIIDVSPLVSERTAVFPGDVAFRRRVSMGFDQGHHLALSDVTTTLHIGAHADAPAHFGARGQTIDQRPLVRYFGLAQVVEVALPRGARILPKDVEGVLGSAGKVDAPRILFKTRSFPDPDRWNDDFNALSPELVHWLADRGVVTVGIDTPSVDPADSKALESHAAILERDLANLEGLVLEAAEPGLYILSALPLRLSGADAAPVRAVLLR